MNEEWERKIRRGGQKKDDFVKLHKQLPVKNLLDLFPADASTYDISARLGISVSTARKWLDNPDITIHFNIADRIAIKGLHLHPANIWGELWWVPEGEDHTWAWKFIDDPDNWTQHLLLYFCTIGTFDLQIYLLMYLWCFTQPQPHGPTAFLKTPFSV